MRFRTQFVVSALALVLAARSDACEFDLALYSDAGCGSCNLSIEPGETKEIFIVAEASAGGYIQSAEFRVAGLPPEWTYVFTPSPASNVSLGDPMGPVGANIGFPLAVAGNCILLYRVAITATTAASDVMLDIVARNPPGRPEANCPYIGDAGKCLGWWACVEGRPMWINSPNDCVVGASPVNWSAIKSIYRQ
jgi:hypothetical protein